MADAPGWALFFLDSQGVPRCNDTAAEKQKIRSLMQKRGISESRAIAILKANGGISKSYGNDGLQGRQREELIRNTMETHNMSREEAIAHLASIGLDRKKKKKKKSY